MTDNKDNGSTAALKGMLIATIAIAFVFSFLDWQPGSTGRLKLPLVFVPLAGSLGGIIIYKINAFSQRCGWSSWATKVAGWLLYNLLLLVALVLA